MKKFTKQELQERADKIYFAKDAKLKQMLATEDGNFFYPHCANYAVAHARGSIVHILDRPGAVKDVKLEKVVKKDDKSEKGQTKKGKPSELTSDELIARIKAATSEMELDELDDMYKVSKSKNKAVKEAYEAKEMSFF